MSNNKKRVVKKNPVHKNEIQNSKSNEINVNLDISRNSSSSNISLKNTSKDLQSNHNKEESDIR